MKKDEYAAHEADYYEGRVMSPVWLVWVIVLSFLFVILAATVVCLLSESILDYASDTLTLLWQR